jgi:hypothetical protein
MRIHDPLREEEAIAYLDDRKSKGFDAVENRVIGPSSNEPSK